MQTEISDGSLKPGYVTVSHFFNQTILIYVLVKKFLWSNLVDLLQFKDNVWFSIQETLSNVQLQI